jgi:hypothetical protein
MPKSEATLTLKTCEERLDSDSIADSSSDSVVGLHLGLPDNNR